MIKNLIVRVPGVYFIKIISFFKKMLPENSSCCICRKIRYNDNY